ncbi:hypothetical protein Tco_0697593 [Tanacetum coccineum]
MRFKSVKTKNFKTAFASQVDVNNDLSKPVTTHHLPKRRESAPAKTYSHDCTKLHLGKIFASSTTKVESEPPNGSNADITNNVKAKQALNVSAVSLKSAVQASVVNVKWCLLKITLQAPFLNVQMTFEHSSSSLGRQCQMASAENNTSGPASFFKSMTLILRSDSEFTPQPMNRQVQAGSKKLSSSVSSYIRQRVGYYYYTIILNAEDNRLYNMNLF